MSIGNSEGGQGATRLRALEALGSLGVREREKVEGSPKVVKAQRD